jgi:drug/metabolite transporter (DMT)-like permease
MTWIHYALFMYISSVVMYLALRVLQNKKVPSEINNFFMWGGAAVIFGLLAIYPYGFPHLKWEFILILFLNAYFLSYLGQKLSFEAIRKAENPGYSLMIQKSYAIYTSVAAVFLFGSELTLKSIVAIAIVIIFLAFLMMSDKKANKKSNNSEGWIRDSFLAFFAFGTNALVAVWMLDQGVDPFTRVFYVIIFIGILFALDLYKKQTKNKELLKFFKIKSHYIWYFIMALGATLFNITMQMAYESTPNVGYVNIINTASIAAITVLCALLFKEKLTMEKFIGVLGVSGGIILLII